MASPYFIGDYEISEDWEGKQFAGIDLAWNYDANHKDHTCCLSIKNYMQDLLIRAGHPKPSKRQLSPHKHREIVYGTKQQYAHVESSSPSLDEKGFSESKRLWAPPYFMGEPLIINW